MRRAAQKVRMNRLAAFYKRKYKKDCLRPGNTVHEAAFSSELHKTSLIKKTGGQLMEQVQKSELNIKNVLTGKGLLETFAKENKSSIGLQGQDSGLPVFSNDGYTRDLRELLACNEMA
jgi:hypothetical protein